MGRRRTIHDFGFDPAESPHHFALVIDGATVTVLERYAWPPAESRSGERATGAKVVVDRYRWSRVADAVAELFNHRLRQAGHRAAAWRERGDGPHPRPLSRGERGTALTPDPLSRGERGDEEERGDETLLAPYFGKELTLLLWAVEDADPSLIPNMLANWVGLAPEERWWLYTTINATTGRPDHGRDRGWRRAIKIAFAENPVDAPPMSLLRDPLAAGEGEMTSPPRPPLLSGSDTERGDALTPDPSPTGRGGTGMGGKGSAKGRYGAPHKGTSDTKGRQGDLTPAAVPEWVRRGEGGRGRGRGGERAEGQASFLDDLDREAE